VRPPRLSARRRRLLTRAVPLVAVAIAAFAAGAVVATGPGRAERRLVTNYVTAWQHHNYRQMYELLDPADRAHLTESHFAADLQTAASTATLTRVIPIQVGSRSGGAIPVTVRARTRLFGTLRETLEVPLAGSGSGARVRFGSQLLFPGLRPGESLTRNVTMPPRAALLADDGTPLAEGPDRTSPIPDVASQIVGTVGPIPADLASEYAAEGYPPDAKVGLDGLERVFESQLAGTPGGTLLAGSRVLARTTPVKGRTVKTTIDPTIEQAAVAAMGGHYAGIAAMDPRTGALLALAGVAFSALQPPGSTMKIITVTAALQSHLAKLSTTFPYATEANIDGYLLQNANGEDCGGTLLNAFAVSCNSVFAPLGVKIGAKRFVAMAEKFGFNKPVDIPGAAVSEIPSAATIGGALDVASSAIGQGKVLASALEMADAGATIAMRGRRPIPTLAFAQKPKFVHVVSHHIASLVQQMMIAVVNSPGGTGYLAAIPGVTVAGKTGTAELRNTTAPSNNPNAPPPDSAQNTDAWFVGYAPAPAPRIVVGALFPAQGAGGATAAPAVRGVLEAALAHHWPK
jgi:cell division protein FtsI/penicillin-binding protein 2